MIFIVRGYWSNIFLSWRRILENKKLHLLLGSRAASQSFLKGGYYDQAISLPPPDWALWVDLGLTGEVDPLPLEMIE